MVWWFVIAAAVLLVAVALWRLDTRVEAPRGLHDTNTTGPDPTTA